MAETIDFYSNLRPRHPNHQSFEVVLSQDYYTKYYMRLGVDKPTHVHRKRVENRKARVLGAHMFISERTVDTHVRSILNKPGFISRAQIAAWVASSTAQ